MTHIKPVHRFRKKFRRLTPQQLRAATKRRIQRALTIGSEWVYFRDDDDHFKDPWAAQDIRIVKAFEKAGVLHLWAVRCDGMSTRRRRVAYSELW